MTKQFSLYRRPTTKGKYIYYVQFRTPDGTRLSGVSTGQTSKKVAEIWAIEQLRLGLVKSTKDVRFEKFTDDFFKWDRCAYLKRQRARRNNYSRAYAEYQRSLLRNHVLPIFGNRKLSKIKINEIENWLIELKAKHSASLANHCLTTLKIIFREALRNGIIQGDITSQVQRVQDSTKSSRGILSTSEVKQLFNENDFDSIWQGNKLHFTINLTACYTGMRMGEILALTVKDICENYITVARAWDRQYGFKPCKSNSQRIIPIPKRLSKQISDFVSELEINDQENLIFHGDVINKAIDDKWVRQHLYCAFHRIGISEEERKARNINFHSWRHYFNSFIRGKVDDSLIQLVTGHKTKVMTDHYTHQQEEHLQEIRKIQEKMLT